MRGRRYHCLRGSNLSSDSAIFACEGAIFRVTALSLPTKAQSFERQRYLCPRRRNLSSDSAIFTREGAIPSLDGAILELKSTLFLKNRQLFNKIYGFVLKSTYFSIIFIKKHALWIHFKKKYSFLFSPHSKLKLPASWPTALVSIFFGSFV